MVQRGKTGAEQGFILCAFLLNTSSRLSLFLFLHLSRSLALSKPQALDSSCEMLFLKERIQKSQEEREKREERLLHAHTIQQTGTYTLYLSPVSLLSHISLSL